MRLKRLIKSLIICVCLVKIVYGLDIAVIASKDFPVDSLSRKDIKKIFLKKKLFIKGKKVIPVNLKSGSKEREVFQKKILKMDEEELQLYWNKKYFDGIKPPIVLSSQEAVIKFVKKVKNAVGYVSLERAKREKDIKILYTVKGEAEEDE